MKRLLIGALITLALVFAVNSYWSSREQQMELQESSLLIQHQIEQVSKLVVTEGYFTEVFTYADSQQLFGPFFTANKKALVVANAKVTVGYDLSQLQYVLDQDAKTLRIEQLPEAELNIYPDLEYYDVDADYFNPFDAADYNAINQKVKAAIRKKVAASGIGDNAEERLLSELSKLYVLTHSLGWTLQYGGTTINKSDEFLIKG